MMPTANPRVNVVLERPLYETIHKIAKKEGVSMSLKVRDFIKQSLEEYEDTYLVELANERAKTFHRPKAVVHEEAWAHLKRKSR
ncbi:MAG: antitoxin, RHH family protein [Candidatus Omnitrophota bacterium]